MPLTRQTITAASRIMLPAYVAMFAGLALNYGITPAERLEQSPGLAYAEMVLPFAGWSVLFGCVSALMGVALLVHRRTPYQFALLMGAISMIVWAVVLGLAAIRAEASPTAWTWPAFVAVACFASNRSLLAGER